MFLTVFRAKHKPKEATAWPGVTLSTNTNVTVGAAPNLILASSVGVFYSVCVRYRRYCVYIYIL